jgi:phage terminase large subunit
MPDVQTAQVVAEFPEKLAPLFEPHPFKVLYGGRDGCKSWSIARALLILGAQKPLRILCARETMDSIRESVHQLLTDQISNLGLENFYKPLQS